MIRAETESLLRSVEPPKPGDLILFSGDHPVHVRQEMVTGCRWAQVAMVVGRPDHRGPVVFESTTLSPCRDIFTGHQHRGVQLAGWSERVSTFTGWIALRRWAAALDDATLSRLNAFVDEVHGRPFDENPRNAGRAFRRRNRYPTNESFFCSQLVAEALQRMGLIQSPPEGPSSNNYIPADFSCEYPSSLLSRTALQRLHPEVLIKGSD